MARGVKQGCGGEPDLVYALVLLQGGFGVLSSFGTVALMGSPVFLLLPLIRLAVMLFLAFKAALGRRWAIIAMIIIQLLAVAGYLLGVLIGLLPTVTFTFNLVGLITGVAMPAAVIWLCGRLLDAVKFLPAAQGATPVPNVRGAPGRTVTYSGLLGPPQ